MDLKIDPEFRAQIPPLLEEERAELERSILDEGVRDRLVVWAGHGILLDGHNRFEIATKHGIAFDVVEMDLPDRSSAADWIDRNQLVTRSLAPDQKSLIRGRRYNRLKGRGKGRWVKNKYIESASEKLAQMRPWEIRNGLSFVLGKEHGVSHYAIFRDGAFASAVEALSPLMPDLEQRIISGNGPMRKVVIAAAAADPAVALQLLAPIPGASAHRRQRRRFNGVPPAEKTARLMLSTLFSSEALALQDASPMIGTDQAPEMIGQARQVVSWMRKFIANMEGK